MFWAKAPANILIKQIWEIPFKGHYICLSSIVHPALSLYPSIKVCCWIFKAETENVSYSSNFLWNICEFWWNLDIFGNLDVWEINPGRSAKRVECDPISENLGRRTAVYIILITWSVHKA